MELLGNLGINGKLFMAQLINFAILFFILRKFAYQPILKVLDERKDKIDKGLKDAQEAGKKLERITIKEKKILRKANAKAQSILLLAENKIEENRQVAIKKTEEEIGILMKKAAQKIQEKKEQMLNDLKKDVAELVIMSTEKVLDEKIDSASDKELIKKVTDKL